MAIQCTICISKLTLNEAANAATCGHVFHEPCLVQWFRQSKTCPQCRAKCDERQVRRLYFSADLNSSSANVDSLQSDLDESESQVRNLKIEVAQKRKEIANLRSTQHSARSTIEGLEAQLKLAKQNLQNANSHVLSLKSDADRLRTVEKELNVKVQEAKDLEYIRSMIDLSVADVADILQSQPDLKTLAILVSTHKKELIKMKKKKDEVANNYRVCQDEKRKLNDRIKQLEADVNTLKSDNNKLQDDLSRMKRGNEPNANTSIISQAIASTSSPSSVAQSMLSAIPSSSQFTPASTTRHSSPYLNVTQSNVGLTPLLHQKRKPDANELLGPHSNLTIFQNPRKVRKSALGAQRSSHMYNGFGGSERKENFAGFPSGQPRFKATSR